MSQFLRDFLPTLNRVADDSRVGEGGKCVTDEDQQIGRENIEGFNTITDLPWQWHEFTNMLGNLLQDFDLRGGVGGGGGRYFK